MAFYSSVYGVLHGKRPCIAIYIHGSVNICNPVMQLVVTFSTLQKAGRLSFSN